MIRSFESKRNYPNVPGRARAESLSTNVDSRRGSPALHVQPVTITPIAAIGKVLA